MEDVSEPRLAGMSELLAAAGDVPAVIRVRNISLSLKLGAVDAWGLAGQEQVVLVSAEIGLRRTFKDSADRDSVGPDTVHYGHLAKAIKDHLIGLESRCLEDDSKRPGLFKVTLDLFSYLAGVSNAHAGQGIERVEATTPLARSMANVRYLSLTVHLPKATLLGRGASMTFARLFNDEGLPDSSDLLAYSMTLHKISVPTLVGVNGKERLSKQLVTVDFELDKYPQNEDRYGPVYEAITKTMASSSFATLEALGQRLIDEVRQAMESSLQNRSGGWRARVSLEKPSAISFAETPVVELRQNIEG